jgi:hypothetical protein
MARRCATTPSTPTARARPNDLPRPPRPNLALPRPGRGLQHPRRRPLAYGEVGRGEVRTGEPTSPPAGRGTPISPCPAGGGRPRVAARPGRRGGPCRRAAVWSASLRKTVDAEEPADRLEPRDPRDALHGVRAGDQLLSRPSTAGGAGRATGRTSEGGGSHEGVALHPLRIRADGQSATASDSIRITAILRRRVRSCDFTPGSCAIGLFTCAARRCGTSPLGSGTPSST